MNDLFAKTKLMCFGRYAVELPAEAEQIMGFQDIDSGFDQFSRSDFAGADQLLELRWKKEQVESFRAAIRHTDILDGPITGSRYFWFFGDSYEKENRILRLDGALPIGSAIYLFEGLAAPSEGISSDDLFLSMTALMRGMRAWDGRSVPREPGVCIDGAFIHEPTHRFQEIMSSGFTFPSMPDVHFSVLSNKNASTEGDNAKGLLQRVDEARREQLFYPYSFLRRGKRTL
ncbi:MAG: hypothetical protein KGO02_22890, partial [Alphaproteobacteria bacterium]|nr:hypothetical protein [Alphaproteobacteria bacterium]